MLGPDMTGSALLKAYRARYGWTQDQAAAACGVALSSWRGWEMGKPMPQRALLHRLLAEAMHAPIVDAITAPAASR